MANYLTNDFERFIKECTIHENPREFAQSSLYNCPRFAFVIDEQGNNILHHCIGRVGADVIKVLIENKVNPDHKNKAGYTPRMMACEGYIKCLYDHKDTMFSKATNLNTRLNLDTCSLMPDANITKRVMKEELKKFPNFNVDGIHHYMI